MTIVDWKQFLRLMDIYTDIHGNELYLVDNKEVWLEYNRLIRIQQIYDKTEEKNLAFNFKDEEEQELIEFWFFAKEKMKEDKLWMVLYYHPGDESVKMHFYPANHIKRLEAVKGEEVPDEQE